VKGQLALDMDKGNLFTLGLLDTASVLFGAPVAKLADQWKASKDESIRAPFRNQLENLQVTMEQLEKERFSAEYEANAGDRLTRLLGISILAGVFSFFGIWQTLNIYSEFEVPSYLLENIRALLPAVMGIIAALWGIMFIARQKRVEERRKLLAERAVELGRRIRALETEKQQLEAHVASSLSDVIAYK
jgi:hypothetical protein